MSMMNLDPTALLKPADLTLGNMPRSGSSDDGFREHLERAQNEAAPAPSSPAADGVKPRDEDQDPAQEAEAAQALVPTTPPPQTREEEAKEPSEQVAANEAPAQAAPDTDPQTAAAAETSKPNGENPAVTPDNQGEPKNTAGAVLVQKTDGTVIQPGAAESPTSKEPQPQDAAAGVDSPAGQMPTVEFHEELPLGPPVATPDNPIIVNTEAASTTIKSKKAQPQSKAAPANLDAAVSPIDKTSTPALAESKPLPTPLTPDAVAPTAARKASSNRRSADAVPEQAQTAAARNAATEPASATLPEGDTSLAKAAAVAVETPLAPAAPSPVEAAPLQTSPGRVESATGQQQTQRGVEQDSRARQGDRQRFVQRVAKAFEAMGDRGGSLRLRLSPPELGNLRLEITVRGGHLTAQVEAETNTARNMLLDNLPVLRERLAQQDIKIDRFEVRLAEQQRGGDTPEQTLQQQAQNDRQQAAHPRSPSGRSGKSGKAASPSGAATQPPSSVIENNRLNVVI